MENYDSPTPYRKIVYLTLLCLSVRYRPRIGMKEESENGGFNKTEEDKNSEKKNFNTNETEGSLSPDVQTRRKKKTNYPDTEE